MEQAQNKNLPARGAAQWAARNTGDLRLQIISREDRRPGPHEVFCFLTDTPVLVQKQVPNTAALALLVMESSIRTCFLLKPDLKACRHANSCVWERIKTLLPNKHQQKPSRKTPVQWGSNLPFPKKAPGRFWLKPCDLEQKPSHPGSYAYLSASYCHHSVPWLELPADEKGPCLARRAKLGKAWRSFNDFLQFCPNHFIQTSISCFFSSSSQHAARE